MKFDFGSIFEHFKQEGRLPERFERILAILEGIETGGEVDSEIIQTALGRAIESIRRCRDGSYCSLNSAWELLSTFQDMGARKELSKLPVPESVLEDLRKAVQETDEEMFRLHKHLYREMAYTIEAEM